MKKTLADFKRDIKEGDKIELVKMEDGQFINTQAGYTLLVDTPIKEKLQGVRIVNIKDTTGLYFKKLDEDTKKRGSFCGYPKADNLEYNGESFTITEKDQQGRVYQRRTYKIIK